MIEQSSLIYKNSSATDKYGEMAPRVGFFHYFNQQDFLVRRWDMKLEDVSPDRK